MAALFLVRPRANNMTKPANLINNRPRKNLGLRTAVETPTDKITAFKSQVALDTWIHDLLCDRTVQTWAQCDLQEVPGPCLCQYDVFEG